MLTYLHMPLIIYNSESDIKLLIISNIVISMESSDLTKVGKIGQDNFEDYSKNSSSIRHIIMDLPIVHNLFKRVASMLPQNYKALNLGSGDGK